MITVQTKLTCRLCALLPRNIEILDTFKKRDPLDNCQNCGNKGLLAVTVKSKQI